jgi:hypothetical protein
MHLTWFYLHCIAAMTILWADATDRLEPTINAFEMSIGLYTEPDTTDTETPPFYIPPTEQDSTWILPPIEGIDIPIDSNIVRA